MCPQQAPIHSLREWKSEIIFLLSTVWHVSPSAGRQFKIIQRICCLAHLLGQKGFARDTIEVEAIIKDNEGHWSKQKIFYSILGA